MSKRRLKVNVTLLLSTLWHMGKTANNEEEKPTNKHEVNVRGYSFRRMNRF